jgi:hypothetical protein
MDVVTDGIQAHPRSHQKLIGPSEIGTPCLRALLHKLNQDPEPGSGPPAWKPAVGTALHNQMEAWFASCRDSDQFLVEQRVNVGTIGDKTISGSTDLFMKPAGAVIDHKFIGKTRLRDYRAAGPGDQYRKQTHIYGRGWELAGWPVHLVMIAFVPRDGELADAWFWWEEYDRRIAFGAMARANRCWRRIQEIGIDAALAEVPPCQDTDKDAPAYNHNAAWCRWCQPENTARTVEAIRASNPFQFFPERKAIPA